MQNNDEITKLEKFKITIIEIHNLKVEFFREGIKPSGRVQIWEKCIEIIKKKNFLRQVPS